MKVTADCSFPPRLFLLERKKNRVECIVLQSSLGTCSKKVSIFHDFFEGFRSMAFENPGESRFGSPGKPSLSTWSSASSLLELPGDSGKIS